MKIKKPRVYVADSGNDRIQRFTSSGTFITKWGSIGTADGQFQAPIGVQGVFLRVDILSKRLFVADIGNNRVQVFQWKPGTQG